MKIETIARFVLIGGVVGGLTTAAMLFLWGVVQGALNGVFDSTWILQGFSVFAIGVLIGPVLGLPCALCTGVIYAVGPRAVRNPIAISAIGALVSGLTGAALSLMASVPSAEAALVFGGVYAVAGAAAAFFCAARTDQLVLELAS